MASSCFARIRFRRTYAHRLGRDVDDAALFGADATIDELVAVVHRQHGDPFRTSGLAPRALGRLLIIDGLSLALADGHVCAEEVAISTRWRARSAAPTTISPRCARACRRGSGWIRRDLYRLPEHLSRRSLYHL